MNLQERVIEAQWRSKDAVQLMMIRDALVGVLEQINRFASPINTLEVLLLLKAAENYFIEISGFSPDRKQQLISPNIPSNQTFTIEVEQAETHTYMHAILQAIVEKITLAGVLAESLQQDAPLLLAAVREVTRLITQFQQEVQPKQALEESLLP